MERVFIQLFKLSLSPIVYGMGMIFKTMQGMGRITVQGINGVVSEITQNLGEQSSQGGDSAIPETSPVTKGVVEDDADTKTKENRKMADNSLSNDQVKVVQYSILTIKADDEALLKETGATWPQTKVFTDNMTGEDFTAWVIAEFVSKHSEDLKKDPDIAKYLRVSYDVVSTYAAEDPHYERALVNAAQEQVVASEKQTKALTDVLTAIQKSIGPEEK